MMGRVFQGVFTAVLALAGLFFTWEGRRMDNYRAIVSLLESDNPSFAASAGPTMDIIAGDCSASDQESPLDIFCPLSRNQLQILERMLEEREAGVLLAQPTSQDVPSGPAPGPNGKSAKQVDETATRERLLPGRQADQELADTPVAGVAAVPSSDRAKGVVSDLASSSALVRRAAGEEASNTYLSDPAFARGIVDQLDMAAAGAITLNVDGLYNYAIFLTLVDASVWADNPALAVDADTVAERLLAPKGPIRVGRQTARHLQNLRTTLASYV